MAEETLGENSTGDQDTMQPPIAVANINPVFRHPAAQECKSWMTLKKRLDRLVQTTLSVADLKELIWHCEGPRWEMKVYKTA